MKCDEEKLNCTRCTSSGRKCDGYAIVKGSQDCGNFSSPSSYYLGIARTSNPIFEFSGNDTERRCFHFFRIRTVPQLSGYFTSDFWDRSVPLSTYNEPAIRHAVIALASLHERYENGDASILSSNEDVSEGGFALQQYNQAIRHLIKPVISRGKQAVDVSLLACILFACFEV